MPDNHLDDQYIDKAWEQMRQTLDQEMPVQPKRRRAAFWWWLLPLLLLLIAGSAWVLWQQSLERTSPKEQAEPARPIADANPKTQAKTDLSPEKTPDNARAARTQIPAKTNESNNTANPSLPPVSEMDDDEPVANFDKNRQQKYALPSENENSTTFATSEQQPSQKPPFLTAPLEASNLQPLPLPKTDLAIHDDVAKPQPGLFRWGLEGGVATNALRNFDGAFSGVIAEFPLRGRKLHLRTGLRYSTNRLNIQRQSDDSEVAFSQDTPPQPDREANADPAAAARINFDLRAQQIALPVSLIFQPSSKWGIEAGANLSFLTSATTISGDEALITLNNSGTGLNPSAFPANRFVNELYHDANQNIDLSELNRWNVTATAGVLYYPADKWALRLHYHFGLTDILKNVDFQSFNQNLRLSAVYYFH